MKELESVLNENPDRTESKNEKRNMGRRSKSIFTAFPKSVRLHYGVRERRYSPTFQRGTWKRSKVTQ